MWQLHMTASNKTN